MQAASYGISKLTSPSFGAFIRNAVKVGKVAPHAIHRAIVNLGPTSFITTNYDGLIEDALKQWRTDAFFPAPVTNKHLVELAEIISARSSHFVFKPHGDVSDISSIILTREQYRLIMPGGERQSALETLKTLLTTRPVIYLGFGLRDPDFLYLRDLLINMYQGAVRDHWAIMPDVNTDEIEYWRSHYGIRLFGYTTNIGPDGRKDHNALLTTLEDLAQGSGRPHCPIEPANLGEAERTLALTRYTSGLIRRLSPAHPPIEARISQLRADRSQFVTINRHHGWTTTRFLLEGPEVAYLIGLPGSGKSFALKLAAHKMATELHQACLEDTLNPDLKLPVLIDLKLYRGDLRAQIVAELPAGLSLEELKGDLQLKLFLDAFNEMPSEHIESGELFSSLEKLAQEIGAFPFVISSRTTDALIERPGEWSFYEIDRFEKRHVESVLSERGIILDGPFVDDTMHLLSRPFFLGLVSKGAVDLPANPRPRDLFESYIGKLEGEFRARFDTDVLLTPIVSRIAFRAIETDSEAFPLVWLSDALAPHVPDGATFRPGDVINWLIAREFLTPYTGRRASFVHQSVTEFLAATELARRSRIDDLAIRDIISAKKWDQCLFLALSLMERGAADEILAAALKADLGLAINAVRYAEDGQTDAVARILQTLVDRGKAFRSRLSFRMSFRNLPVEDQHIPLLRILLEDGGAVGGEAVSLIALKLGSAFKSELLDLLAAHGDDYNFSVNGIAASLAPLIEESDLPRVLEIAEQSVAKRQEGEDESSAISAVLACFEPKHVASIVRAEGCPPEMATIVAQAMRDRDDEAAYVLLAELLLTEPRRVISSLAIALGRLKRKSLATAAKVFDGRHVEAVWNARFDSGLWYSALRILCSAGPELKNAANQLVSRSKMDSIALAYFTGADDTIIFTKLEELLALEDEELSQELLNTFPLSQLNWRGRQELLFRIAAHSNVQLQHSIIENHYKYLDFLPPRSVGLDIIRPVLQMLDAQPATNEKWWIRHRLGELIAHQGDGEVQAFCLSGLLNGSNSFKEWIKSDYIGKINLTSDSLNEDMIAVLLADLNVPGRIQDLWYNPLGHLATERLVTERLLPLADSASPTFRENLSVVLLAAGNRHHKRYLLPD